MLTKRSYLFLKETVDSLRKFVNLDMPFLKDSRIARIDDLDSIILQSNVTTAEKFRKVFEAYFQLEAAFGNTIETYPGFIELDDQTITVDYFRIGRLGWYYRSANGRETGYWDKFNEAWVHTNGKLNDEIKLALDIANRQTPPKFYKSASSTSGEIMNIKLIAILLSLPLFLFAQENDSEEEVPIPIEEQRNNKIKALLDVVKENKSIYVQKTKSG